MGHHVQQRLRARYQPGQGVSNSGSATAPSVDPVAAEVKLVSSASGISSRRATIRRAGRDALPGSGDQSLQQLLAGRSVRLPVAGASRRLRVRRRDAGGRPPLSSAPRQRGNQTAAAASSANATIAARSIAAASRAWRSIARRSMRWPRCGAEPDRRGARAIGTPPRAIPSSGIGDTVIDTGPHAAARRGHQSTGTWP